MNKVLAIDMGATSIRGIIGYVENNVLQIEEVMRLSHEIIEKDGDTLAHGLVAHDAYDARLIAGHHSAEITHILGRPGRDEIVHRNDLAML